MNSNLEVQGSSKNDLYSRIGLFLLFGVGLLGLWILPFTITSDGFTRFEFMDALVHKLQITPMRYSMVGPLLSLPLWLPASFFHNPSAVIARYNYLLYICVLFVLFRWLKPHFEQKFLIAFLFILSFGTMFPGHLINYFGEAFSALFLALGTVGLAIKKSWVGWVFMMLAAINTPALMVPLALVAGYWAWETKQLRYVIVLPVCLVLIILESRVRMGSLSAVFQEYLRTDHGRNTVLPYSGTIGYSYPFVLGVLSIFLSFGKGLVFYCPGLLLIGWVGKSIENPLERKLLSLWLIITVGLVLAYASWWAWYGGWYWGPRFFLFASFPAAWILARLLQSNHQSLLKNVILFFVVVLSLWVGVNGMVFQQKTLDICTEHHFALESLCWYVPEFSPLIRPFVTRAAFGLNDKLLLIIYGGLWVYSVIPLLSALIPQIKVILKGIPPLLSLPSWRF